jgi:Protein of unknown function (DUF1579)
MQQQPEAMKALSFLIGKWSTQGTIKADDKMPETAINGTDSYEWILNGCFILHKVDVMMGDTRTEAVELIGEFDNMGRTYKMRSFDGQGSFTVMEAHLDDSGAMHILGNNMRSKLSIADSNNMTAHWERSADNKNWQPWMDLAFSK